MLLAVSSNMQRNRKLTVLNDINTVAVKGHGNKYLKALTY
jgi:hypothetical protein